MVEVPLVIGAVGDIDVEAGNSGAVSALSWYGRLKELVVLKGLYSMVGLNSSPLCQIDPGVRINADENCEQESCCDCCNHH
jgi:hypothetical protein